MLTLIEPVAARHVGRCAGLEIIALNTQVEALKERLDRASNQLRATEEELAVKATAVQKTERAFSDKESQLAKLMAELDERSTFVDAQKIEIIALNTQVEALKERLDRASNEFEDDGRPPRCRTHRAQGGDPETDGRTR